MPSIYQLLALIPFYFLGAFPTGLLLAKSRGIDLTHQGSGNVGATNVTRTLGRKFGVITLIIDAFKGYGAAGLGFLLSNSLSFAIWAGVASVLGHCFSIPGKLKGGKGVATGLGVLLFLDPVTALCSVVIFLVVAFSTHLVSLGSLCATLSGPLVGMLRDLDDTMVMGFACMALIITFRHKDNLKRLIRGEELRLGRRDSHS